MILRLEPDGPVLRTPDDAMDLIATTFVPGGAETIVVPVSRWIPTSSGSPAGSPGRSSRSS